MKILQDVLLLNFLILTQVVLKAHDSLYINVGGRGDASSTEKCLGGYNGGGISYSQVNYSNKRYFASGGGATHIATKSGLLNSLENYRNNILIVSGGGSGYIGNSLLSNKAMYRYNCEESSEESTKTISTTCVEETPTSNCAKKGNGYARITYIGS